MLFNTIAKPIRTLARSAARYKSTLTVHEPGSDCRQLALPLAFLAWDNNAAE